MNVKFSPHSISTNSIIKKIPLIVGYYYVVDAGFPLMKAFLPPYKGHRYHLSWFNDVGGTPHGNNELFNYNHLSLRNVIERCFGMLMNRFPMLEKVLIYLPTQQPSMVIASCTSIIFAASTNRGMQYIGDYA